MDIGAFFFGFISAIALMGIGIFTAGIVMYVKQNKGKK